MRGASRRGRFRQRYGASPLHLAGHLIVFAIAAFAIARIASNGGLAELIALYVGFVIAHDLVFVPAYRALTASRARRLRFVPAAGPPRCRRSTIFGHPR